MHLTRMRFGGVPPFTAPVEFRFDERVNVFAGANATGKSRLLSAIDDRFNETRPVTPEQIDLQLIFCEERDNFAEWTKGRNLLCGDPEFADAYHGVRVHAKPRPPVVYVAPTRSGLPGVAELGESDSYGSTLEEVLSGRFCGGRVKAAIDMLYAKWVSMYEQERQEELATGDRRAWNFLYMDRVTHACARAICDGLITSDTALNYPTGLDLEYLADQPGVDLQGVSINRMLGIRTSDTPSFDHISPEERPVSLGEAGSGRIYVGDLSSGAQTTLLWILWLAARMLGHYELVNGWNEQPAVLLIDEIENHLHPTWQRRVIPALLQHFPGLQIFATTHSPFVVAGLRAGQVHMLKRDAEGVVTGQHQRAGHHRLDHRRDSAHLHGGGRADGPADR